MNVANRFITDGEPRRVGTEDQEILPSSSDLEDHKPTNVPPKILQPENAENSPSRRGRPRLKIRGETVRQLAAAQLSTREIAAALGCSRATIETRFSKQLAEGRAVGTGSVKRELFRQAVGGNLSAVLAFLRGYAGFSDRVLQLVPAQEEPDWSSPHSREAQAIEGLSAVDRNFLRSMFEKVARIAELNSRSCLEEFERHTHD